MKVLIAVMFISSCLTVAFAENNEGASSSISSQGSVRGRILSIDKEKTQLTVQDSSTGATKAFTALDPTTLNLVKEGDQVEIYLTSDGQIQSIVEK